jgi:hypothetical protein
MNVIGCFKGDYIAAVEFDGKTPTLTIDHVKVVQLEDDKGATKSRPVVYFHETKRGWVLCKTTALALSAMFTPETDTWTGKKVTLHAVDVQVGRETKPGIRVKGSPDLNADVVFELKLPKKKAQTVRLVKTGGAAKTETTTTSTAPVERERIIDTETGEAF